MSLNRRMLLASAGGSALTVLGVSLVEAHPHGQTPPAKRPAMPAPKRPPVQRAPVRRTRPAAQTGQWEWKHYGRNPYAATPEEAFRKLPEALKALGVPAEHHQAFIALVREHPGGMQTGHTSLKRDDRLTAMMEGGGIAHRNVVVKFMPGIEATTFEWYHAGLALVLPHVCHNWSWREICVELHFNAADGMLVQVYIAAEVPFPMPNHCLAYRQGNGSWQEWKGSCGLANCDYTVSLAEVRQVVKNSRLTAHHPLGYKATTVAQTLRFDRTVYQKTVVICLIYVDPKTGRRHWSVMYMPGDDWNERTVVHIDNKLWQWHG